MTRIRPFIAAVVIASAAIVFVALKLVHKGQPSPVRDGIGSRVASNAGDGPRDGIAAPEEADKVGGAKAGPMTVDAQKALSHVIGGTGSGVLRRKMTIRHIEAEYGDILDSWNLSPETLRRVRELLAEREVSVFDLKNVDPNLSPEEHRQLRQRIQDDIDREIAGMVSPEVFAEVHKLTTAGLYVSEIKRTVGTDCSMAGLPLQPSQILDLGMAYYNAKNPRTNPSALNPPPALAPVDSDGLSKIDRDILTRTSTILSPPQQAIMKSFLVEMRERLGPRPATQRIM